MANRRGSRKKAGDGRAAISPDARARAQRILPILLALVFPAIAVCLYLPTLGAEFVYDARAQVLIDDYIHDPGNLSEVLTLAVFAEDVLDNNRPVHLLSMMIDSLIWGKDPLGYHLTSILLHGACVAVIFLLVRQLLNARWARQGVGDGGAATLAGASVAALLFAVHPANTEAVCEVSYREDLLAALFIALGLLLAGKCAPARGRRSFPWAAASALSFALAAGSKETGIVGPPLVLLYWLLLMRKDADAALKVAVAGAFVVVAAVLTARFALAPAESVIFTKKPVYIGGSLLKAIQIQPRIWAFQLSTVVWPSNLCADQTSYSIRHIELPMALGFLSVLLLLAILVARKDRVFALGVAIYILGLLPVSNLHPIYRPIADRYLYLPMIGCAVALACLVSRLKFSRRGRGSIIVLLLCLGGCAAMGYATVVRQRVWHDSFSLWRDTRRRNPGSFTAANSLGFELYEDGELEQAIQLFKDAIKLSRNAHGSPWVGLALAYDDLGQTERSDRAYRRAAELDPRYKTPAVLMAALVWREAEIRKLETIARRSFPAAPSPPQNSPPKN